MTDPMTIPNGLVQAAAAELTTPECPWHETCAGGCEAAEAHARAVLNAVRPDLLAEVDRLRAENTALAAVRSSIEADALDALADGVARNGPANGTHLRGIAFMCRQGRMTVREWLARTDTEESR